PLPLSRAPPAPSALLPYTTLFRSAVVGAKHLAVLVSRVHHLRVARIERERPDRQAVIADRQPFPVLPVVGLVARVRSAQREGDEVGRAHVSTPVTDQCLIHSSP